MGCLWYAMWSGGCKSKWPSFSHILFILFLFIKDVLISPAQYKSRYRPFRSRCVKTLGFNTPVSSVQGVNTLCPGLGFSRAVWHDGDSFRGQIRSKRRSYTLDETTHTTSLFLMTQITYQRTPPPHHPPPRPQSYSLHKDKDKHVVKQEGKNRQSRGSGSSRQTPDPLGWTEYIKKPKRLKADLEVVLYCIRC